MSWEQRNDEAIKQAAQNNIDCVWYILRVDPQKISKAIDTLPRYGIEAFAPTEQRTRRSGRGRRSSITVSQPIMSGYVIAGFRSRPNWYELFSQLQWLRGVVSQQGQPAPVPARSLQRCFSIHQSTVTSLPGAKSLRPGDTIRVLEGGWRGHEAKLIDISGADCEFVVQLFGRDVKWRQPIDQVEAA